MADYNEIKNDAKTRMEKSLESLKADFGGLRAGRAHASLLDGILVEAYGSMTPLSQIGTISVPDARTLSVSVWDRGLAKSVEKALRESELGLNPASDGQLIRIPIPPLSEERRKELVGEGEVFYDYLRNGLAIERKGSWHLETLKASNAQKIEATDLRIALPIPQSEIDANPNIQQNPR